MRHFFLLFQQFKIAFCFDDIKLKSFTMKKILVAVFVLFSFVAFSNDEKEALIIIDEQDFYFEGGDAELVNPVPAAENTKLLLDRFRQEGKLVIYVKHNYEPGGDIYKLVAPIDDEKIFTKDDVNAFLGTGLNEYLKECGITKLVLCGMQTHMCLEAATRAGHDLGYKCIVIGDACATRDLKFNDNVVPAEQVHLSTLATLTAYAKVMTTTAYLDI